MTFQSQTLLPMNTLPKVFASLHSSVDVPTIEMGGKCEFSLVTLTAVVHHYKLDNRWIIVGPSRVGIYHDTEANSFRIVARKIEEHEVVANCLINESFCYDESTPSFHQWRDTGKVYGIKFTSPEDGGLFADTIRRIVHTFEQVHRMMESSNVEQAHQHRQQHQQQDNGLRPDRLSIHPGHHPTLSNGSPSATAYLDPMPILPVGRNIKPVPPPPPPPQNVWKSQNQNGGTNNAGYSKPTTQPKPGPSFLNEMELTLARRRAKIEAQDGTSDEGSSKDQQNHSRKESNLDLSTVTTFLTKPSNGISSSHSNLNSPSTEPVISSSAIEKLKQEILCEIREELALFKQDLIQAIKEQLNNYQQ